MASRLTCRSCGSVSGRVSTRMKTDRENPLLLPRIPPFPRRSASKPPLNTPHADVLDLGVVVQPVLRAFAADAGLLHPAERRDLGGDQPGVDADDAAFQRFGDAPAARQVAGVE